MKAADKILLNQARRLDRLPQFGAQLGLSNIVKLQKYFSGHRKGHSMRVRLFATKRAQPIAREIFWRPRVSTLGAALGK